LIAIDALHCQGKAIQWTTIDNVVPVGKVELQSVWDLSTAQVAPWLGTFPRLATSPSHPPPQTRGTC